MPKANQTGRGEVTACRHRNKIKTIRFSPAEREFLEMRAVRTGRDVNSQVRELVRSEMKRAGIPLT